MDKHSTYHSPFEDRYQGAMTSFIFSDYSRYTTWRRLWLYLARAEKKCGIPITDEQIDEMSKHLDDIPYERVKEIEAQTHHDVVAHLRAYAEQCPTASPIIHLGATSCYITDNTDVLLMHKALWAIGSHLSSLVEQLSELATIHDTPMVGRTHFQPAQPVTLGKRLAMWASDFEIDIRNLRYQLDNMALLGCRGATGTADSFLQLFNGDTEKVEQLEQEILEHTLIKRVFPVTGQTYPRKQDFYIMQVLSGIAQSASKFATDIRLLAGLGEVSESFGDKQVGSSAMPYKQNPITCEKICGLARYVIVNSQNTAFTASSQWLERTLDDSSNRRLLIPELFMTTEVILQSCTEVIHGLKVHTIPINWHLELHKDNAMMEGILVESVKRGGDRQYLHEKLRHYMLENRNMVEAVSDDPDFKLTLEEVTAIRERISTGLCNRQVGLYEVQRQKAGVSVSSTTNSQVSKLSPGRQGD